MTRIAMPLQIDMRHRERAIERFEFSTMQRGQSGKQTLARLLEMHLDLAPIGLARLTTHETRGLATRDERDDTMMLCLQALGEFADRRPISTGEAFDMQQQQILERRDAFGLRRLLRKSFKATHLISKRRQLFEVDLV